MPTLQEIYSSYADRVSGRQFLICWGYDPYRLASVSEGSYMEPAYRALMHGFHTLAASRNRNLRERSFIAWSGEYGELFWVGIPGRIASSVVECLSHHMMEVPGYQCVDFAQLPLVPLKPRFRYDNGSLVEYLGEEAAGEQWIDDESRYGTGLTVTARIAVGR